jgi:3-hydroxyisobutyrate dehydrogenase-like beta-hydroxyacid dehydrogenase
MTTRVGFVGVGLMGHGMARNLVEKGFPLTVMAHRNRKPVEDLKRRGAKEAKSVAALVEASDVVILCVTGSPQVEGLVYGTDGIVASARKGLVVIDTSTSEPTSSARIHADLKKAGAAFVDAPLTRTPVEAEQGRLNTMVGADAKTFKAIKPVLDAFCENVFHVGPAGAGHKLKLINNFFAMGQVALIAEAFAACAKVGLDPRRLVELVSKGAANSGIFQMCAGRAVEGDYTGMKFALVNARKDVDYFNRMADAAHLVAPMAATVLQSLRHAIALGFEDRLVASMVEAQCKLNGVAAPGGNGATG